MKKRKRESEDDPEDLLRVEADMKDQTIIDQPDLPKPELPKKFDEKQSREKIEEKYKQIKRRPGEPILVPEISYSTNITNTRNCPM